MKNNLVFKFIAVVLCAASLLGAIGSIAGVVVLSSGDLYNKTVDQVREERTAQLAEYYADALAMQYASSELGGCPERMVTSIYGSGNGFQQTYDVYGYRILDAEGNVLSSYNDGIQSSAATYTLPITGQYMHLVSVESESERMARVLEEQQAREAAYAAEAAADVNGSTIPASGIFIDHVGFLKADGSVIYEASVNGDGTTNSVYWLPPNDGGYNFVDTSDHVGFLFCNSQGQLVYQSFLDNEWIDISSEHMAMVNHELYTYNFVSWEEDFHFQNSGYGLGTLSSENGILSFVSSAALPAAAEETVPETEALTEPVTEPSTEPTMQEETIPATSIPETVPETTADVTDATNATEADVEVPAATEAPVEAAETAASAETVPSAASAVPEETGATMAVTAPSEETEAAENTEALEYTEATAEAIPVETMPRETLPETLPQETIAVETMPEETEPVLINGKPLDEYQVNSAEYYDLSAREQMTAQYVYVPMPEMTVEVYVDPYSAVDSATYDLLSLLRQFRNYLLPAIGICLFVFAVFAVYLCTAAGRKPKSDEVRAGGLNRLPLDLYLCGGGFAIALIAVACVEGAEVLLRRDFLVACGYALIAAFAACLIFVGFCFAFVAQIKTPGGFWWKNTLCGIFLRGLAKFAVRLEYFLADKGFPFLGRFFRGLWQFTCRAVVCLYKSTEMALLWIGSRLGNIFRWIGGKLNRWLSLMPVTWQWTVTGMFLFCMILCAGSTRSSFLTAVFLIASIALILYGAHCFGVLLESTKKMGKGNLDTKVDDKLMIGCFDEFARDLNDLADVAVVAAQKQLKSERMKTELITNVSHDIKTPLTSIINYVDLLQKPHTVEEEAQYLEVLDRQSQRLKKLIDDLMDMSKANTGNMQVDITQVDAVESVNQALGEFADKLDKARLIPVFRHDQVQVPMMADGRLVWRVLSNLLSNAVKYAMPGTRLYIDLMVLEGKVVLSLKNISREELNVDADELMERFVRGDDSRNTEGSGLGLNIAKSLMELQKGQLQLLVDGDLFKVTLIFPGV